MGYYFAGVVFYAVDERGLAAAQDGEAQGVQAGAIVYHTAVVA
jgi:hypothetical protein